MREAIKPALNSPGDHVTKTCGRYKVSTQLTTDGGYTINTFAGPTREHLLCFGTADVEIARIIFAVIRDGGRAWKPAELVVEDVKATLTAEMHRLQRRTDRPSINRVEAIYKVLNRMDSPADREALAVLAAALKAVA